MPRNSIAARNYSPGIYGPYQIDGFISSDTQWLEVTFTVDNWPNATPLITGEALWDTGDGAQFQVNTPILPNRSGVIPTIMPFRVSVPRNANGNLAVTSGTLTFQAYATLRTAISIATG